MGRVRRHRWLLWLGVTATMPAAAADLPDLCSGPDATLECVERNFQELLDKQHDRFWTILNEQARLANEGARRGEGCSAKGRAVQLLSLARVKIVGADFDEFRAEQVERLCLDAAPCFRKASALLDEDARGALHRMLDNPLIADRQALARAKCLGGASPKPRPEGRMHPGEAGAWTVARHYLATDFDAAGDRFGLVKSGPTSTSRRDVPASCLAKRMSIAGSLELVGSKVTGDKATVAVRYRKIGEIRDGLVRLGLEADESLALDLVRDSGGWWIARPYLPHVSSRALLGCLKHEYEKLDASGWEHASDAQKTFAMDLRTSIAELRNVSREAFLGVLEDPQVEDMRESVRVAFRRPEMGWESFPDGFVTDHPLVFDKHRYDEGKAKLYGMLPAKARWTACFRGRRVGEVASTLPPGWPLMALRGTHVLDGKGLAPWVDERSDRFAGFPAMQMHRPLALSSTGLCGDPGRWRERPVPDALRPGMAKQLDAAVSEVRSCESEEGPYPCNFGKLTYEIRVGYESVEGEWLVEADGVSDGRRRARFLFFFPPSGHPRVLGLDMTVLDAGDYDGDGRSELLVKFARYDHDGYTLFFGPDFEGSASFGWMYH